MNAHARILALCAALLTFPNGALAASGDLRISPAATLEGRITTVIGQKLVFRLRPDIAELQTVTLNLTRSGRVVGDYPMRRDGEDWVTETRLQLPYTYVVTLRLFEKNRVWAAATDLYSLERLDAAQVKPGSTVRAQLDFVVTEGKPGGDTNPLWGIAAMLVLFAGVFLGTQGLRRRRPKRLPEPIHQETP